MEIKTIKDFVNMFDSDRNQMCDLADFVNNKAGIINLPIVLQEGNNLKPAIKTDSEFYNFAFFY